MSQDLKLNPKQREWIMKAALERIKDAPHSMQEIEEISRDTLHLVTYGTHGLLKDAWYAKILLKNMPKGPQALKEIEAVE